MDRYVASGLIGAACLLIVFAAVEARRGRFPDLVSMIQLVLACTAIGAGVRLGVVTVTEDTLGPFKEEDRIFLVLGALSLGVVSLQQIVGVFRSSLAERQN